MNGILTTEILFLIDEDNSKRCKFNKTVLSNRIIEKNLKITRHIYTLIFYQMPKGEDTVGN